MSLQFRVTLQVLVDGKALTSACENVSVEQLLARPLARPEEHVLHRLLGRANRRLQEKIGKRPA